MKTDIYRKIIDDVRVHPQTPVHLLQYDDTKLLYSIFRNFRGNVENPRGFRLSKLGYDVVKEIYPHWEMPSVDKPMNPKHLITMDRNARLPYYLDKDIWGLFDSEFAMSLKLVDGSLKKMIENEFF